MNSRERVIRAIAFKYPDRVPILHEGMQAAPLFEHGEKLVDLWRRYPGDSGDPSSRPIPKPDPRDFQPDGKYHRIEVDEWGTTWEHRIFGVFGIPIKRPLDDLSNLKNYEPPPPPETKGEDFERKRKAAIEHKKKYYLLMGGISIFEKMQALRRFDRVLIEIERDASEINKIADMITEYQLSVVKHHLAVGADGVGFGDDFGAQNSLMISVKTWRRFFKHRYETLMEPVKKAGKQILFHSCGYTLPLIDDLADLGINTFWPQLDANDNLLLAKKLHEQRICLTAHMPRQYLIHYGTPQEIDVAVKKVVDLFRLPEGGLVFWAEIDPEVPFQNIEALFQAFYKYGA